jgi:hypothetical protein
MVLDWPGAYGKGVPRAEAFQWGRKEHLMEEREQKERVAAPLGMRLESITIHSPKRPKRREARTVPPFLSPFPRVEMLSSEDQPLKRAKCLKRTAFPSTFSL